MFYSVTDLQPNWDGEGAPVPSPEAIAKAREIVVWAKQNRLTVESVDPDVLGGVAVYLSGTRHKARAWISILNAESHHASTVMVIYDDRGPQSGPLTESNLALVLRELNGESNA